MIRRFSQPKFVIFFWKLSVNFAKLVQKFMDKYLKSFDFPETVVSRYSAKKVFLENCKFCKFLSMAASGSHKIRNCPQILCLISIKFKQINKLLLSSSKWRITVSGE